MKFTQQRAEGANLIRRYGADFLLGHDDEVRSIAADDVDAFLALLSEFHGSDTIPPCADSR